MRRKATDTYESIRQSVLKNKVIGADETGVIINGKTIGPGNSKMIKLLLLRYTQTGDIKQLSKSCRRVFKTIYWLPIVGLPISRQMLYPIRFVLHICSELQYLKERHKNSTWAERMSLLIINALVLRKTDNRTKANVDKVIKSFMDLKNEPINSAFEEHIPFRK